MGIPILTSEGFVGQRWIIDDYFRAGETLSRGMWQSFGSSPTLRRSIGPRPAMNSESLALCIPPPLSKWERRWPE